MNEQDWSEAFIAEKIAQMRRAVEMDPLDEQRDLAAQRAKQEKRVRIADALPGKIAALEQSLKRDVPDSFIDERIAARRTAQGEIESNQRRLPAQVDRKRVEERLRFAQEMLEVAFDSELVQRQFAFRMPRAEWDRHVSSLNLSFRERVRYEAEAEGRLLDEQALNEEEARRNAYRLGDGLHAATPATIDKYIATAKKSGIWPLPELHTGPGSRPTPPDYLESDFMSACEARSRPEPHTSPTYFPERAPVRRLQSRRPLIAPDYDADRTAGRGRTRSKGPFEKTAPARDEAILPRPFPDGKQGRRYRLLNRIRTLYERVFSRSRGLEVAPRPPTPTQNPEPAHERGAETLRAQYHPRPARGGPQKTINGSEQALRNISRGLLMEVEYPATNDARHARADMIRARARMDTGRSR
ncbi:hypothetical protein AGR4C_pa50026 [Agrobacterium tumefaciens str. Kerr 14]|uniref:Uncharacterized protein n=1 Tax=Agrobacterium tumefaciens str. Kerr 14 TaxID=1183424 RepID=A0A1S7SAC6_AGRTU|nr:hypothetical protein [Agrobacterium tumefaciens]CUX65467.1 hypothetical protein AGR4C_pa50026 [Agrobacterium tumefaciens str. Kerr 14]